MGSDGVVYQIHLVVGCMYLCMFCSQVQPYEYSYHSLTYDEWIMFAYVLNAWAACNEICLRGLFHKRFNRIVFEKIKKIVIGLHLDKVVIYFKDLNVKIHIERTPTIVLFCVNNNLSIHSLLKCNFFFLMRSSMSFDG